MDTQEAHQRRGVIYLRVASPKQKAEGAIARQREGCRWLAAQHGLTIVREYVDIGRPARLEQQVELLRLLDDLHQRRDVACVVVWDYARLGRSMTQLEQVTHHIRACGAEIITMTGVEVAERFIREHQTDQPAGDEEA